MPKLMPSLRHTKSEEHLDSNMTIPATTLNECTTKLNSKITSTTSNNSLQQQSDSSNVKIHIDDVAVPHTPIDWTEKEMTEDDVWSQEDDEITSQYLRLHKICERDALSQMSLDSIDSKDHSTIICLINVLQI